MKLRMMRRVLLAIMMLVHLSGKGLQIEKIASSIKFKHLSLQDGLSQTSVLCILQDSKGFLWFGTRDGLNRYDGYSFITYQRDDGDPNSLSHNWIKTIHEDAGGNLWVGTYNGLNLYEPESDGFKRFLNDPQDSNTISSNNIWDLFEHNSAGLWIGTNDGLNFYDPKTQNFTRYYHEPDNPKSIIDNRIRYIFEDSRGNLWISTYAGTDLYNVSDDIFIHYPLESTGEVNDPNALSYIAEDKKGNLWLGNGQGLFVFNDKSNRFDQFQIRSSARSMKITSSVRAIHEDAQGELWVGTYDGLYSINLEKNSFRHLLHDENDPHSLSQNSIYSILEDTRGDIWVGTWSGGINFLDRSFDVFKYYSTSADGTKLSYKVVSGIVEDEIGNFWIGTEGGGLNYFDRKADRFSYYRNQPGNPNSLSVDNVKCVIQDRAGGLWIGTHDGGLNYFNPAKSTDFIRYKHNINDSNSLSNDRVISLLEDQSGKIWVGTSGGGLDVFDPRSQKFTHIVNRSLSDEDQIFLLKMCYSGDILIGSNNGMIKMNPTSYKILPMNEAQTINPLPGRTVLSAFEDKKGGLWIGTEGDGLYYLNMVSSDLINYNKSHGLPNNVIYGIIRDNLGDLWMSTNKGLSRLNLLTKKFKNYDVHDGLQNNEFNYGAYAKSASGELIFGGVSGFNIFDPLAVIDNQFIPPVMITDFRIRNRPVVVGVDGSPLSSPIMETEHINLTYDQSEIEFDFVALSYSQPKKNQYAYRLNGFGDEWIAIGNRRSVSYTNLPPGEYKFEVKATNNDLVWNEEGVSIGITIAPPPWQTWWAYVLYFLASVLIAIGIRRVILIRIHEKHAVKHAKMEKDKIEEVNKIKLQFFTNVSHEFRTPLTLIIGPLERLIKSKEGTGYLKDQLSIMQRNAYILLRLINQLMDFRKNESGKLKMKVSKGDMVEFTREIMLSFVEHARYRNVDYQIYCHDQQIEAWFDHKKMEEILFNLLSNAFKFTPDYGKIAIRLSKNESSNHGVFKAGSVELCVEDNGRGMSPEDQKNIFDRFYQVNDTDTVQDTGTGIGLALTKDLVELHHGEICAESQEEGGSRFIVQIPLGRDHFIEEDILENFKDSDSISHYLPKVELPLSDSDESLKKGKKTTKGLPSVLIVEDNQMVRDYIKDCLSEDYEAHEAGDGEEGFQRAKDLIPDLIISDIMMPKMDGIKLCSLLKREVKTSHIPVILLTARASDIYKKDGLETGADDYITKPFNPELLLLRIKNLVESRNKLREKFRRELTLEPKEITVTSADDEFLQRCVEITEEHMSDSELTVSTYLDELGFSRSVFYKKLKALTGQSVTEFIRAIRLKRAAQLLNDSDLNISEVAYKVGFNDLKYFRNCFRKIFNLSPSEYRADKAKSIDG